MNGENAIPCPDCKSSIVISPSLLIMGNSFTCPNPECLVRISLNENSTSIFKDAMDKFNHLKNKT